MAYGKMVRYTGGNQVARRNSGSGRQLKRRRSSYGNGMQNLVRSVPYVGDMAVAGYNSFRTNSIGASASGRGVNPILGRSRGSSGKRYGTTGKYVGKFSKIRKYTRTKNDKNLMKGYGIVTETKGAVTGVDSVYLGVTSFYLDSVANTVSVAVLRKLFKKCGYDISDPNANLELSNNADTSSLLFRLVRKVEDANGGSSNITYDFIAGETLYSLALNSGFMTEIINYATGLSTNILSKIYLVRLANQTVSNDWIQLGSMEVINELVEIQMKTTFTLQNRTRSTDGSADTDRVDNQPLQGRTYKFKKSSPIVNHVGNIGAAPDMTSMFEKWSDNHGGVHLISDQSPGFDATLRKLPSPVYFNNCKLSGSTKLDPGEIKDQSVFNSMTMYYVNFIKKLAWYNAGVGLTKRAQKVADCILFGFEERMDSGSANNITVQYEACNRVSAYLRTGRGTAMKENYVRLDYTVPPDI